MSWYGAITTTSALAALVVLQGCGGRDKGPKLGEDPCRGQIIADLVAGHGLSRDEIVARSAVNQRAASWRKNRDMSASSACAIAMAEQRVLKAEAAAARERARTPPPQPAPAQRRATAPALPARQAANGEELALILNLNGYLCGSVVSVNRLTVGGGQVFEVNCIEYRGGSGRIRYLIDMRSNPPRISH